MPHTDYYRLLMERCNKLQKSLLPRTLSPTGNYKESTYEKVRGYKILVHAELEYYFEELAKAIMTSAKAKWDKSGETTKTLLALVAYCDTKFLAAPDKINDQRAKVDLDFRIKEAYQAHYKYISMNNNGIKEKNIISLFLPVGVNIDDLDNNLMIALDSFGSDRGQIAHKTRAMQCQTPDDAKAEVRNILTMVNSFDVQMEKEYL